MNLKMGSGAEPPKIANLLKICVEKSMETCNSLKGLMEILPFYGICCEYFLIFSENLDRNLEVLKICICTGFAGLNTRKLAIY